MIDEGDMRQWWIENYPEYKALIEEKYDDYLAAEVAFAKNRDWTDEEIRELLIDDNGLVVRSLIENSPVGFATISLEMY